MRAMTGMIVVRMNASFMEMMSLGAAYRIR